VGTAVTPLPRRTRVLYASASLGGEALTQSRNLWLVYYYAPPEDADLPELLSPLVVGIVLTLVRLAESLDDVLIGWWSDRTTSRLGRRLPFIVLATPFAGLFAALLFMPPGDGVAAAVWLAVTLFGYFLFSTLSSGPYEALFPEIAQTTGDRLAVVGTRVYFGAAGGAIGLVGASLLIDSVGYAAMAIVMAIVAVAFRYLGTAGVWHRASRTAPPALLSLRDALRLTVASRSFLLFLPSFVLFQVGVQLLLADLPFFVKAVLEVEEEDRWVAGLTAVAIAVVLVSVPFLTRVARRTSKRRVYLASMLGAALLFPLLGLVGLFPVVPAEAQLVLLIALVGVPLAGAYLFPAALTADIIDEDETRSGLRREATYFGAQNLVEKTVTALTPLLLGLLLVLGRTTENSAGVRLAGLVAGAIVFCGYLVFRRYQLEDDPARSSASASTSAT
jgi:GPH family glycoside/pentoside/hexuronide:cation symporter